MLGLAPAAAGAVAFTFHDVIETVVLAADPDCLAAGGIDCVVETTLRMRLAGEVDDEQLTVSLLETPFETPGSALLVRGDAPAVEASWSGGGSVAIAASGAVQVQPAPPGSLTIRFAAPVVSGNDLRFRLEGAYATAWGSEPAALDHAVAVAPEPASALLLGLGLGLVAALRRGR